MQKTHYASSAGSLRREYESSRDTQSEETRSPRMTILVVVLGHVTHADTLSGALDGIDAIVFALGSDGAGTVGAESVDYGGVRNVLRALGSRKALIALMTSIGVTNRTGNLQTLHRSPRLDASLREISARQPIAVHHCSARLVRL
jgi:hypothetical protein